MQRLLFNYNSGQYNSDWACKFDFQIFQMQIWLFEIKKYNKNIFFVKSLSSVYV